MLKLCRLQIQRNSSLWYSAEYSTFSISDEVGKYRLTVSGYSGDAGNALMTSSVTSNYVANLKPFSTWDDDNDGYPTLNCAALRNNGWWFGTCSTSDVICESCDGGIWVEDYPLYDVQKSRMLMKLN